MTGYDFQVISPDESVAYPVLFAFHLINIKANWAGTATSHPLDYCQTEVQG